MAINLSIILLGFARCKRVIVTFICRDGERVNLRSTFSSETGIRNCEQSSRKVRYTVRWQIAPVEIEMDLSLV